MYIFAFRSGQKSAIEDSIAELKKAMEGDNADAIKAAQEDMTQGLKQCTQRQQAKEPEKRERPVRELPKQAHRL